MIVPFLDNFVMCHGAKKKKAGLTLHTYADEESILKDRKKWHEVVRMVPMARCRRREEGDWPD